MCSDGSLSSIGFEGRIKLAKSLSSIIELFFIVCRLKFVSDAVRPSELECSAEFAIVLDLESVRALARELGLVSPNWASVASLLLACLLLLAWHECSKSRSESDGETKGDTMSED